MRFHSLLVASAAGCALVAPGAAMAANTGTVTVTYSGSSYSITPSTVRSSLPPVARLRHATEPPPDGEPLGGHVRSHVAGNADNLPGDHPGHAPDL